jgi:hypothetical protein
MFDNYTVDRATLWAAMADAHVTHAIVEFSGGNDEGGADSIQLDGKEVQIDYTVPLHDLLARLPHERD